MEDSHRRLVFASTLPSTESAPGASYSLLSLPPALLALISSTAFTTGATPLEIRGHTTDAAVLVTPTETYSLRGVQNSNSLLLCSTAGGGFSFREDDEGGDDAGEGRRKKRKGEEEKIAIEGTLHETLEVVQGVARTDRLVPMLQGSEYSGEDAEEGRDQSRFLSFTDLQGLLPASDKAIIAALRAHRVVTSSASLRLIAPSYLLKILPSLLASFTPRLSTPIKKEKAGAKGKGKAVAEVKPVLPAGDYIAEADLDEMLTTLDSLDCSAGVARGVLEWFGAPKKEDDEDGVWCMRVGELVREVGIGLLESGGYAFQPLKAFETSWATLSHPFSPLCSLPLLAGTHILSSTLPPQIQYFPLSHLSPDPTIRFDELFAVKPRWADAEMTLFVNDLVGGDRKKREALVLKFVRKVKEEKGPNKGEVVWTSRKVRK